METYAYVLWMSLDQGHRLFDKALSALFSCMMAPAFPPRMSIQVQVQSLKQKLTLCVCVLLYVSAEFGVDTETFQHKYILLECCKSHLSQCWHTHTVCVMESCTVGKGLL